MKIALIIFVVMTFILGFLLMLIKAELIKNEYTKAFMGLLVIVDYFYLMALIIAMIARR